MFKGLRTKIESEQKGHQRQTGANLGAGKGLSQSSTNQSITPTNTTTTQSENDNIPRDDCCPRKTITQAKEDGSLQTKAQQGGSAEPVTSINSLDRKLNDLKLIGDTEASCTDVELLKGQISRLRDQLKAVMEEKNETTDQSVQLQQQIEHLRQSLETEQATSSSLQDRLKELEAQATEKSNTQSSSTNNNNKSFNPDRHLSTTIGPNVPDDVGVLRNELIELQAQLAKKNRQLKIRQQNLNDIKKTLQKEILDHSKTQEELAKLQRQLQTSEQDPQQQYINNRPTMASQNGSDQVEPSDMNQRTDLSQSANDKNQDLATTGNTLIAEDTLSLNAALGGLGSTIQSDRISCLSRSTTSADDLESHDLNQSNNNNNKAVSHEYLRNVLYRYMTSTDNETTQHLVKAISVLMDFSPEQSAAIKSAMNSRSSWLRLK